jgi:uncharacterized protein (TIGR02118 family)
MNADGPADRRATHRATRRACEDRAVIKLVYCLRRRPDMSWEEFSRYWRDVHAPLVASHAETLGIRRYVQVRTLQNEGLHAALQARNGGSPAPFDGVAEIWVDSIDTVATADEASQAAAQALLDDERNFIDLAASPIWLAEEWQVVAPG